MGMASEVLVSSMVTVILVGCVGLLGDAQAGCGASAKWLSGLMGSAVVSSSSGAGWAPLLLSTV